MTATSHTVTGLTIGLLIGAPIVAVPVAVVSHYLCDALPHFGPSKNDDQLLSSKSFKIGLTTDALMCISLVAIIASLQPAHWLLACVCGFAAAAPDLLWLNHFISVKKHHSWIPGVLSKFASAIQWFQRPIGVISEAAWLSAGLFMVGIITNIHL